LPETQVCLLPVFIPISSGSFVIAVELEDKHVIPVVPMFLLYSLQKKWSEQKLDSPYFEYQTSHRTLNVMALVSLASKKFLQPPR
jgi:hypothetical protein